MASWDHAEHPPLVHRVDKDVARGHREEESMGVAPREVEDYDAKEHVQEDVTIAAEIKRQRCEGRLRVVTPDRPVGAHDELPQVEREEDGHNGLDHEADEKGGRKGISVSTLSQKPLDGIGFEALSERGHILEGR